MWVAHILVFASNLQGIHGAGSAKLARAKFGAQLGVGEGPTGSAYAIPTRYKKGDKFNNIPLAAIAISVAKFIEYAKQNPGEQFNVLKIGCGLAGYTEKQIAPMFKGAPPNCHLPIGWRN